jgi:transposase
MQNMYVGIDLGLKGPHIASVYSPADERYLDKSFNFGMSFEGFEHLLEQVHARISSEDECSVSFVMEPTGMAWMPLSCFLVSRGYRVYRVTTQKSSDLRKFLDKHTKSDRADAQALAKLPIVAKEKVYELYLPSTELGTLSRKTRYLAKLTQQAASRKTRIGNLFAMINPGALEAFGEQKFRPAGKVFFRYFSNPFLITELGREKFYLRFRELCSTQVADSVLDKIYQASVSTTKIYEPMVQTRTLPFNFQETEKEICIELDLLDHEEGKIAELEKQILTLYRTIDPEGYLMTPQGIGPTIAPAILGIIGDVSRFPNIDAFRAYFGFIPKKKQSSSREKKGMSIHKAAQGLLKKYMFLAAEVARQYDPEFASFYDRLMKKGHHHYQAICALANKMAGRLYALLNRMQRAAGSRYVSSTRTIQTSQLLQPIEVGYKLRDLNGRIIDKKEGRRIVLERFPSKSQRRKNTATTRTAHPPKKCQQGKSEESPNSLHPLSGQPRQLPKSFQDNSSKRSGKTLPAGIILKDTFPELLLQSHIDNDWDQFKTLQDKQKDSLRDSVCVNKLCTGGEKKSEKRP